MFVEDVSHRIHTYTLMSLLVCSNLPLVPLAEATISYWNLKIPFSPYDVVSPHQIRYLDLRI